MGGRNFHKTGFVARNAHITRQSSEQEMEQVPGLRGYRRLRLLLFDCWGGTTLAVPAHTPLRAAQDVAEKLLFHRSMHHDSGGGGGAPSSAFLVDGLFGE